MELGVWFRPGRYSLDLEFSLLLFLHWIIFACRLPNQTSRPRTSVYKGLVQSTRLIWSFFGFRFLFPLLFPFRSARNRGGVLRIRKTEILDFMLRLYYATGTKERHMDKGFDIVRIRCVFSRWLHLDGKEFAHDYNIAALGV